MSAIEILRQARELIADKSRWTQGAIARRADGAPAAYARGTDAVCWCAKGAVLKQTDVQTIRECAIDLLDSVSMDIFVTTIVDINDDDFDPAQAHKEVLTVFDAAIKRAEAADA